MKPEAFKALFVTVCMIALAINVYIVFTLWMQSEFKGLLTGYLASMGVFLITLICLMKITEKLGATIDIIDLTTYLLLFGIAVTGISMGVCGTVARKKDRSVLIAILIPFLVLSSLVVVAKLILE